MHHDQNWSTPYSDYVHRSGESDITWPVRGPSIHPPCSSPLRCENMQFLVRTRIQYTKPILRHTPYGTLSIPCRLPRLPHSGRWDFQNASYRVIGNWGEARRDVQVHACHLQQVVVSCHVLDVFWKNGRRVPVDILLWGGPWSLIRVTVRRTRLDGYWTYIGYRVSYSVYWRSTVTMAQ